MRKSFLLISLFFLAVTAKATETTIGPNNPDVIVTNALYTAVNEAEANDVIILQDGIYKENNVIVLNKNLTIRAAEGAHPIVALNPYMNLCNGAAVTFQGIKFDGLVNSANNHCIRAYSGSTGSETLTLDACEFTQFPSYIIYTQKDDRRWNSITVRNCYFYNNTTYAIVIDNEGTNSHQSCNSLTVENTTFANITTDHDAIYYDAPEAEHTTSLSVNHCTFYNIPRYAIYWTKSPNLSVSNCIFAHPTTNSNKSVYCTGGTITKCLSYKTGGYSTGDDITITGELTGNPYFLNTNPAHYDFTVWTTSPAHNAATDGNDLGDYLRWNSDPSTHIATINITADDVNSLKAAVEAAIPGDEIILAAGTYEESESISIDKDLTIKAADGASPIVKLTKNIAISNAADVTIKNIKFDGSDQSSVSNFIYAADATNNSVTVEGCEFYSFANSAISIGNSQHFSACTIDDCYFHGFTKSAVYFPKTSKDYHACDALHISNSTFADFTGFNAPVIAFYNKNETTNSPAEDDAELRVDHCTFYKFIKSISETNTFSFIDSRSSANSVISNCIFMNPEIPAGRVNAKATQLYGGSITNCLDYNTDGHRSGPSITGRITAKHPLFYDPKNGNFKLHGGSPACGTGTEDSNIGDPRWGITISPTTDFAAPGCVLETADAILDGADEKFLMETSVNPYYLRYADKEYPGTATWKITATRSGFVKVKLNFADNTPFYSGNKHIIEVQLWNENETVKIDTIAEGPKYTGDGFTENGVDKTLSGALYIPAAGNYTIKLLNNRKNSKTGIYGVTLTYAGGSLVNIPGMAYAKDAVLESNKMYRDEHNYIHYNDNGTPTNEYAFWKIHTASAYSGKIILDIPIENTSGHQFHVELYAALDGAKLSEAYEAADSWTMGLIELSQDFEISGEGDYYVKVINHTAHSGVTLRGISIAPSVTISETATDLNDITNGAAVNVTLTRSFVGGMYNTICLPFAVSAAEMNRVFPGAVVKQLTSSSIEEGDFVLNLNFDDVDELAAGTPYLINPAADVTNPKFIGVTIDKTLNPTVTTRANFAGTFVKSSLEVNENILFLGANNKLYFPTASVEILGMRGWFVIHDAPVGAIKRARIVENNQVATDIDIISNEKIEKGENKKILRDGQLIILRDGVQYNVMGTRMK